MTSSACELSFIDTSDDLIQKMYFSGPNPFLSQQVVLLTEWRCCLNQWLLQNNIVTLFAKMLKAGKYESSSKLIFLLKQSQLQTYCIFGLQDKVTTNSCQLEDTHL